MTTRWLAQLDGGPTREVPYARISAYIQATPRNLRRRQADGSLVIGAWKFWMEAK